jgi:predicted ATP-grasp superfamily ATP-dependent carboligase
MTLSAPEWAIVAGAGLNGLGVARSLGAAGVKVAVIDCAPGPAHDSRFARIAIGDAPERSTPAFLEAIVALARRLGGRPVLVLTQEATVVATCEHPSILGEAVRHVAPDPDTTRLLLSKERTHERAEAMGFPVPRTVRLASPAEVEAARALTYPVVLKPAQKSEVWERSRKKAYRFEGFDQLAALYGTMPAQSPPVVVQEWIEGDDTDIFFTLVWRGTDGQGLAFTGRKLRQWPPGVGGTASCAPVAPEVAAELEPLTERFLAATGCVGLASVEYKRDRRSGRFLMVEPTVARTDFQEEVATLNGANLALAAYRAMLGLPLPAVRPPARGVIWREAESDTRSAAAQPGLRLPPEAADLRVADALWRAGDPGPWLADLRRRLRRKLAG